MVILRDGLEKSVHIRRCPSCGSLNLEYNEKEGKFHCNECGFNEFIPKLK
jgi:predicted RNA-binding Zn-ribbon protein involved in translation (DUF1610 family)